MSGNNILILKLLLLNGWILLKNEFHVAFQINTCLQIASGSRAEDIGRCTQMIFKTVLYNLYLHFCGISTNNPTSIRTYWSLLCIHKNLDLESDIHMRPSNLEKLGSYWIPPSGMLICLPVRKALAMFKRWMPSKVKLWALVTLEDMVTLKNFPPNWSV